jgi:hypothetical protein
MNKVVALSCIFAALIVGPAFSPRAEAQDAEGNSTKNERKKDGNKVRRGDGVTATPHNKCEDGEIVVRCTVPGCVVTLDQKQTAAADAAGEARFRAAKGRHTVVAAKPQHEAEAREVPLDCGKTETVELSPKPKAVSLRIRTSLPECDIYVNNSPSPVGKSDAKGVFEYRVIPSPLLVQARKKGYLSEMQRLTVSAGEAVREVAIALEPIKASLSVSANVEGARVSVDGGAEIKPAREKLLLTPGKHQITVDALGYVPVTFEVNPAPDEKIAKPLTLERLPVPELMSQAERLYELRAYRDVLTLSEYALESDAANGPAHRLAGLTHMIQQDYRSAGAHLEKALSANETVRLQVRRHPGETFDLTKGHNDCVAVLILNKSEVELQARNAAENFKVGYGQVELTGVQLKKNVALYLGTKVTATRGRRREYNFYSFDNELSQTGRPFLNMLQLLLRPH